MPDHIPPTEAELERMRAYYLARLQDGLTALSTIQLQRFITYIAEIRRLRALCGGVANTIEIDYNVIAKKLHAASKGEV